MPSITAAPTANPSTDRNFDVVANLVNGNLDTDNLKDSAITTAKLAASAVTTAKLANDSVTPAKLLLGQASATVTTEETTTSTTYADLSTVGPSISYTAAANESVLLLYGAVMSNSAAGNTTFITPVISGATTLAAADGNAAKMRPSGTDGQLVLTESRALLTTLTAGANTLKLQYRVEAGTGTFSNRYLILIPLG